MRCLLVLALALAACSSHREDPLVAEAKANDKELSAPRPIFTVANFQAAQAYYRDKLGMEVLWEHEGNFGAVARSQLELFLCGGCQHSGSWAMVFTHDLDKLHAEFAERGAIVKQPPTKMPWGLREMQIADPDGNVIRFGSGDD